MIGEKTESMALLTQISIGPNARSTSAAACSTAFSSATSSGRTMASPPSCSISRLAPSSPSSPRAISPTFAPRFPNARAVARPTPAEAPVMTTTSGACMRSERARRAPVLQIFAGSFRWRVFRLFERQYDVERRPGAGSAFHDHFSAVLGNDLLHDREAKSRSTVPLGREQRLENMFENLGRDTRTAIANEHGGEA